MSKLNKSLYYLFASLVFSLHLACSSGSESVARLNQNLGSVQVVPKDGSSQASTTTVPASTTTSNSDSAIERLVHEKINNYRIQQGKTPLEWNSTIANIARIHSTNMANNAVPFSHQGFANRAEAVTNSLSMTSVAENIAFNHQSLDDPAQIAVNGWIDSPPHHQNILGDFTHSGVGISINADGYLYYTQIFAK